MCHNEFITRGRRRKITGRWHIPTGLFFLLLCITYAYLVHFIRMIGDEPRCLIESEPFFLLLFTLRG